jgi:phosphatidylserine/phosphatidylglycerophosphate/cardiolipin synthase-like enzyme
MHSSSGPRRVSLCLTLTSLIFVSSLCVIAAVADAEAALQSGEWLCDDSYQDCRAAIITAVNTEPVTGGIDVSFWFMNDYKYVDALIGAWKRGVPVRVLFDPKADATYAGNKTQRDRMVAAGIPLRAYAGSAINHWKAFIFAGQRKLNFSAANFSNGSYSPVVPYTQYVDEAVYFTDDPAIVNSFQTKFEDRWTNATRFRDFANITSAPARKYPIYPIDPSLNFVPDQNFQNRLKAEIDREGVNSARPELSPRIDAVIFRITSAQIPDALVARAQAGVPVRLINEKRQYRSTAYFWDAYNIDRMYKAGVQIKIKNNITEQDLHQKSIILYTRALAAPPSPMVVFGSSNWTSSSAARQEEHNDFSTRPWMVQWFADQFERKWNNLKADGTPIGTDVFVPFTPLAPEVPVYASPANDALNVGSQVTLKWEGGWWAHKYDIYLATTSTFSAPMVVNFAPGAGTAGVVSTKESYGFTGLLPGTTYYWKIVSKTMADVTKSGPVWHFTTASAGPPPAPTGLRATFASASRIDLAWNDVAGEQGYKIERKLASDSSWTEVAATIQNVTAYSDANSGLTADSTYDYRVRAFSSAGISDYSPMLVVTTSPNSSPGPSEVVLYAAKAPVRIGKYTVFADAAAAGGQRLDNPDAGAPTVTQPLPSPPTYIEISFSASAGVPYRLWIRGKASNDSGYNDSVWIQFSDAVTDASAATRTFGIGSTSGTWVNLQDCSGTCRVQGWGWQDNGYGGLGPQIFFATSGTHTLRVQPREDGFSIDQIVLSPATYLNSSPGPPKNDSTILPEQDGARQ